MFAPDDILYEDNHLIVINKHIGDLVQPGPEGGPSLEDEIKAFIKSRDRKPGNVFLGVVHRIDRPVSGAVVMAKTSKALARLNEMIKERRIAKTYWAIVEKLPAEPQATLRHYLRRDGRTNVTRVAASPDSDAKEAVLSYKVLCSSDNYHLLEVALLTGRHHQIRAQLSAIGCPIRGDLKYGAARSLRGGGISLHSRRIAFTHPVSGQPVDVIAPVPEGDNLWAYFENNLQNHLSL